MQAPFRYRPTGKKRLTGHLTWAAWVNEKRVTCSASVEVRALQHVVNGLRVNPERAADPDGGQLAVVHEAVHRHLADPHQARHFGDGEKLSSWRLTFAGCSITCCFPASRIPCRWPFHRRHRNPINQARPVPAASPPLAPTRAYPQENSVANGVIATGVGYSF